MKRPEEQLHRAVVQLLQVYQGRGLLTFCHPYNSGFRTKAEAGIGRSLGVRAGVPDLLVWTQGARHFAIELKAGAGKLSPAQASWHDTVSSLGHRVYVCRSVDDVERCLRAEAVPPIGTLAVVISANVQERAS